MNEIEYLKIEDKSMPVKEYKDIDFDMETDSRSGFTNILFLVGLIFTSFMWGILIFLGR